METEHRCAEFRETGGTVKETGDGVFLIYTGGTVGCLPKDARNPMSPLAPTRVDNVLKWLPTYDSQEGRILISGRWVRLGTFSWDLPFDSSNITSEHWREMAKLIRDNYREWEGFVILHGTDTLAYTASALAFMLDNLAKPVVITGAQRPIGEARTDAVQNLVTAIEIAASHTLGAVKIPEVCVFFGDHLYRGCRATKLSASSYNAFSSPNHPPLASAGEHVSINKSAIRPMPRFGFRLNPELETQLTSLFVFPGMSTQLLRNILATKGLRGVALQTFGVGNVPNTPGFLEAVRDAVASGKVVVNVTQCRTGEVKLGRYDVSVGLLAAGVVSGVDMTAEAALTKMAHILGTERDPEIARDLMQLNLKGEQRTSIFNLHYAAGATSAQHQSVTVSLRRPVVRGNRYDPGKLEKVILRIMDLELVDADSGEISLKAYIDLPDAGASDAEEQDPHFLGRESRQYSVARGPESMSWSIGRAACRYIDPLHASSVTIVGLGAPFRWRAMNIAVFAGC